MRNVLKTKKKKICYIIYSRLYDKISQASMFITFCPLHLNRLIPHYPFRLNRHYRLDRRCPFRLNDSSFGSYYFSESVRLKKDQQFIIFVTINSVILQDSAFMWIFIFVEFFVYLWFQIIHELQDLLWICLSYRIHSFYTIPFSWRNSFILSNWSVPHTGFILFMLFIFHWNDLIGIFSIWDFVIHSLTGFIDYLWFQIIHPLQDLSIL